MNLIQEGGVTNGGAHSSITIAKAEYTADTQRGGAKTLECDYKSGRMSGFFFLFSL